MASEGQDRCGRCSLSYNKEERCPRTLVCGHTSCTSCLDALIQSNERRCPSCSRPFFSYSTVLIPKDFQVLRRLGESSKSSLSSSYSSPLKLKSSLSVDSSLSRSSVSRERFSASSTLAASKTEGSFDIGGSVRPRSDRAESGLSAASAGVSSPPPPPSSAPPTLDETSNDLQVSGAQVRSPSGVDGVDGGSGGSFSRLSKSSSMDEAAGTYTTPSYSFPAIRTRLSSATSRATDTSTSITTATTTTKTELRPVKSLPPLSSSAAFKSPSISSPLSAEASSSPSFSTYTSPFLRTSSSSSSSSSSLNASTIKSLQSGYKKLSLDSSKEMQGSHVTSPLSDPVDSSGLSRSMPSLHKLESKLSVPSGDSSQDQVDLGLSKWKLKTSMSLSRKSSDISSSSSSSSSSSRQDTSSLRMYDKDTSSSHVRSFARSSATPTHVLRMCRSITSKTRPAADEIEMTTQTSDPNTSPSSEQRSNSSSSFSLLFYLNRVLLLLFLISCLEELTEPEWVG
ncbi:A-agglutinin anchorage subunit-like [Portunus trituberculatus]|uniref:A-agglutinin anchorage subunit-like n=1 Tax=Portunus trituberculatus TaxID=210409 RepID=UPI001E1CF409|nr:A-agglutinin anchorage subunit-like [Portunus trituberculatus]